MDTNDTAEKDCSGNLVPPSNYYCDTWIKADPTFEGLKQIICEPHDRVAIQDSHPDTSKYYNIIDRVKFSDPTSKIFSVDEIGLSSGLNAIIGGKSSGKSLLLNMLAAEMGATNTKIKDYNDLINRSKIEVYYKDDPTQRRTNTDGRKIEFLPQLYINELVSNKENKESTDRSFNTFIEDLIRQDDTIKSIMDNANEIIIASTSNIDSDIAEWHRLDSQLVLKKEERSKLGDKTAIENEIKRIVSLIEQLKEKAGWSESEKESYNNLVEQNEEHRTQLTLLNNEIIEAKRLEEYLKEAFKSELLKAINLNLG